MPLSMKYPQNRVYVTRDAMRGTRDPSKDSTFSLMSSETEKSQLIPQLAL